MNRSTSKRFALVLLALPVGMLLAIAIGFALQAGGVK